MVHITSAVLVAALVAAPVLAAPIASDDNQLDARSTSGRVAKKAAENVVEGVGQGKMKDAIKKYTNPPAHIPEGLKDAAKKHTSGFSQSAVDHVTGHGKKKRDLNGFEEFFARNSTGGRAAKEVAKNVVEGVGQSKMKDTIKKYTSQPVHVPDGLKDAAKKHTSGFSQSAVDHVTGHGKKKRDLEDFEEFFARSSTGGRAAKEVAKNVVEGVGQSKMKDAIKKYTNPPAHVPEGLKDAAKKHTSGFSQSAVDHVTGHGKKKRDLEDFEELFARSSTGGRAAKEVAKNVVEGVGQSKMKDTIKKYTSQPVHVPDGLKDAAKKHTSGFSQSSVDHVTGHGKKKRDVEEFEEFFARSSTGGRAAKEVAKNVVEGVGQSKMKDAINKYTKQPVHVPDGLKDAAKKHTSGFSQSAVDHVTGHGKKKRDLDEFDMYERDFEDFEDVFERGFDDYLEERDYFDELEEREFYELNELD